MAMGHWLQGAGMAAIVLAAAPALAADAVDTETGMEEILVTAQRREQTLFEVPQSVAILSGATLEQQQATSFLDYVKMVPGMGLTQDTPGESRVILRGVNTGSVGSTVAIYVDDSPFGASGSLSNGGILAGDFDTFDIERIEVLRGPQGTLYGSNALGGVLRFITAKPSTDKLIARGQAGVETTKGGGTSWYANAMANVPLGETLAFRASGFYRDTAGYIDAAGRNAKNVNDAQIYGGRASLLFAPSDNFSVRLFALAQNIDVGSPSNFTVNPLTMHPTDPITGANTSNLTRYERIAESNTVDYRMYSGTIDWAVGFADLTSITSYSTQIQKQLSDISTNSIRPTANFFYAPAAPGTIGVAYQNNIDVKKFTQEVRLASPNNDKFEWVVGGYYTHEDTGLAQEYLPFSLATEQLLPTEFTFAGTTYPHFVTAAIDAKYEEVAAFGSATLHLGDRFDITAGGRYSHNSQSSTQEVIQLGAGTPQDGSSSEGVFTWSVSPRFEINDRTVVYARVAKGYRPGGPNFIPPNPPAGYPSEFSADTLISYEVGLRAETPERTFSLDASVYYLDWSDILILGLVDTPAGPVGVNTNGQDASSVGVELTAIARPIAGLTMTLNFAYNDAKLLDDTVPSGGGTNLTGGYDGDQLPYAPKLNTSLAADYEWSIGDDAAAWVGGNVQIVSEQPGGFNAAYRAAFGGPIILPGYMNVDLRAGVRFGGVTVSAYARNLTNELALISAGAYPTAVPTDLGGQNITQMLAGAARPRTFGATVGFSF
ncbi:TonB-dependent receptor [Sandaracinobacteroides hominis]|uniref:TonB-dependent receptor n=1 Tax=Sandaracinobacteroides hominis TaxID=2780086 RepID=UPI0018F609D9|nr:TonB-dependent receptor [Sandaracinobacteroides hominis]